ncbi:NET1-associated nuclear protein 1 [[Candida] jaroonii]|uniref:NET1-associated nuclear protein 1 n=1 Tax=[Candida] jaroonii TaxID=467808 RepID=A0ACA9YAX3_9ASCO|nr:NET1-associated nuclear protein 1 [[Candida] jaroonii]
MEWSLAVNGGQMMCPSGVNGGYSEDGRHFITVLSHQIRVYFLSTRQCIKTIEGNFQDLVDVKVKGDELWIGFSNRTIKVNWKSGQEELVHDNGVMRFFNNTLCIDNELRLTDFDQASINIITDLGSSYIFAISANRKFISILSHNQLFKYHIENETLDKIPFTYKSSIISIDISNDGTIALGSSSGPIQIIFPDNQEKLLKWHIGPVKSLVFTNSNQLVSGGMEKVLVIWSIITDKLQFLPRLNGVIDKIFIDHNKIDNYNVILNHGNGYELLILSAVDLISRLSVNTIRPNKLSNKNSIVTVAEIFNNNLYLTNDSLLQIYNVDKNEQSSIINLSESIGMGKVKSELKLNDPVITHLKFNSDYMCTFDKLVGNNDYLSKDDITYCLKFWKKNGETWDLITKIINPHYNLPVINVMPFQDGFITIDNRCNLRFWRFKKGQWSLVKNKIMNLPITKFINIDISDDNSLIVLSYDNKLIFFNNNLIKLDVNLNLSDCNIRGLQILKNQLIVLSKTRILSFNLIDFTVTKQFKIPEKIPIGGNHLIAKNSLLCLSIGEFIIIMDNLLNPIFTHEHSNKILSIIKYNNSFIFIDELKRLGFINNGSINLSIDEEITPQITKSNGDVKVDEVEHLSLKVFDNNSFNFESDNLDSIFEKIIKIVNN